ncbi:hypothetical protein V8G54_019132 [Vigna mungo]|uniref:Uncharacterized protein n=1 Tax=Vigna mungo TaxID=3915 RepID=A0AAQ3NAD2_VIGMU
MVNVLDSCLVRVKQQKIPPFFKCYNTIIILINMLNKMGKFLIINLYPCFYERLPKLLRQNAAIVRYIDGLKNAVNLQLLVVHVPPELLEIHSPIIVRIASVQQILRVLVIRRNLKRRETSLDERVVQEPAILSVEEFEEAPNPHLTRLLRLLRRQKHVIQRHR